MTKVYSVLILICSIVSLSASAQSVVRGHVIDGDTGEPMFSASVVVPETGQGVTTDFDGLFRLEVVGLPVVLQVSFIGYGSKLITVSSTQEKLEVKLIPDQILIGAAEVVGSRISEKQKQAPLTVETMDLIAIKEAPSGNFYEGLGNLKGVDITSASLGFKIINTRGFNSTSPVRSLQLIDGVDNQSPGLNFSLGNFLGAPDLDVKSVEIIAGASSAFFGPGAFNGVINMETKDPFVFPGLSVSTKLGETTKKGERPLFETGFRWADVLENDEGDSFFAYKINFFRFEAYDWEATNYDPIDGSSVSALNPGRFDAVNIYGDEFQPRFDYTPPPGNAYRGLGTIYRTGYKEVDLVDYNTNNTKLSVSGHWRLQPEKTYESPELIYGFNMGKGTTVYQGDNRFSLKNIEFYQHRLELRKKNKWFIRAYRTNEDAGDSYDPYATALKLQDSTRNHNNWARVYEEYWVDSIAPSISDTYPELEFLGFDSIFSDEGIFLYLLPLAGIPEGAEDQWFVENQDNLTYWHSQVEQWTNEGYANLAAVAIDPVGHLVPGSDDFNTLFNQLITSKNNEGEGGTRFHDLSSLVHVHGEYIFEPWFLEEIRVGANFRQYTPVSEGTIFSDTSGVVITNAEAGAYLGAKKRFLEDDMIVTGTVRVDKNVNFPLMVSPAISLVWSPNTKDFARVSFSSALRNPTLADQYLFLDVGPATLVGNLNGVQDLVTIQSFIDYRAQTIPQGSISMDPEYLEYFDIAPIRPEQVRTFEAGYRTTIGEKLYIDAGCYFSTYTDFIGYNIGLDIAFAPQSTAVQGIDVYRYAANSINEVKTQGASVGLQYYLDEKFSLTGNYSWNKLVKTNEDDPIIPAFNTPEHKFNLGITARGLDAGGKNSWGFGVNYRWVQQFVFEGSPQFTGGIPQYDLVDAQINLYIDQINTTFKIGGSNLLSNQHIETYGGPQVGRLAYVSILYDFAK
ncbi:MAG: carboxypeptidase-like regulatory domain-containing protein [Bacteroidetes bacterium]|jgi:iron complex outermembrane recepter protein|nr:carboxypeptidase-like regulatory domain-containing protein [Bacteroidota bacterium]